MTQEDKNKNLDNRKHYPNRFTNTLGDLYNLKKMLREKGYKLRGNQNKSTGL